MKRLLLLFILFVPAIYIFAGDYDFSALQGLRDKKGNIYFEISGYDIFYSSMAGKVNDLQTRAKFKKQHTIKGIQTEYSNPDLGLPNHVIETVQPLEKNPNLKSNQIFYLFSQKENEIKYIVFQTINQRDTLLEKEFIKAFLEEELANYISDDWTGESISFAGRTVQLGTACQWRSPHNLFCKGGQISWSEFLSAESAEADLNLRIVANNKDSTAILSQDYIEIVFEELPTIALRVSYLQKNSYYPLIVYYVTQEIRGKYISCIMSNYGYNRNDYELSSLLQQFMSIPSPPAWAYNRFDIPQYEKPSSKSATNEWKGLNFEIRSGAAFPLGNLNRIFQFAAPSFDLIMGFSIKQNISIDCGLMVAAPAKKRPFNYTDRGETFETKARTLREYSLRYRYMHTLNKNISYITYIGIGMSSILTDLVKETTSDNQTVYQSVDALDLYAGVQLRYKKLGYFVEYHRSSFPNSSKVENNFGSSFLYTGFSYSLGW